MDITERKYSFWTRLDLFLKSYNAVRMEMYLSFKKDLYHKIMYEINKKYFFYVELFCSKNYTESQKLHYVCII